MHKTFRAVVLLALLLAAVPALRAFGQAPPVSFPSQTDDQDALGLSLWRAGQYESSIATLTQSISLRPSWPVAYNTRSLARAANGDLDGALADAEMTMSLLPLLSATPEDWAAVFDTRAYAHLLMEQWDEALEDYDAALTLTVNTRPAYVLGRGITLLELGDERQGLNNLKWGMLITQAYPVDPQLTDLTERMHAELRELMPEQEADAFEPDDRPTEANSLPLDGSLQMHSLHTGGDIDWVSFPLESGQRVLVFTRSESCDTYLTLFGPDGRTILREDDDGGEFRDSELQVTAQATGTYYAQVRHFFGDDGTCESYAIGGRAS